MGGDNLPSRAKRICGGPTLEASVGRQLRGGRAGPRSFQARDGAPDQAPWHEHLSRNGRHPRARQGRAGLVGFHGGDVDMPTLWSHCAPDPRAGLRQGNPHRKLCMPGLPCPCSGPLDKSAVGRAS